MAAPAPPRVNAPVKRFSSTERRAKQWRPSMTWMQPRRTSSLGERACTSSPSKMMEPLVTSPRSAERRLEIALSVVDLPAPFAPRRDRKSTRLNSSHLVISYAVFCLKKKINIRIVHLAGHVAGMAVEPTNAPLCSLDLLARGISDAYPARRATARGSAAATDACAAH